MRISMVSEHGSPLATLGGVDAGGQNVHVAALSAALAARGHDVTVFTRRDDPHLPERMPLCPGVEVVHVSAGPASAIPKDDLLPYMPAFADRLADAWRADAPDLVHSHFWMSGVAALDAARRPDTPDVPVAHTFHALGVVKRRHQGLDDTSPVDRAALEPAVGRGADTVVATCSDEAFELIRLGVPSSRISVVPCGVDTDLFHPEGSTETKTRAHRIMTIGRLVPRKGVGTVITALARLARDDIELVVVGGSRGAEQVADDPDVQRLAALARDEGVAHLVSFRGQVSRTELPAVVRSADLVVCAPWYEPFGIVPLEAMATGVPVVATAVGGLIDTVVHGTTGVHVPPRDADAIATAVTALLADPGGLAKLGRAGAARGCAAGTRGTGWPPTPSACTGGCCRAGGSSCARRAGR
ncbi:D-inositol-3-phosphate glycosyltransferase [Microbacterium trichothecenolyticum]|uniref:D-inositol 3-phosphate glycosyltransferase n=1 Tax=Microbacterium trichothecenolyticum TaxID=69370 RepID=A0ABU0TSH5_MICTR|nr:glycosyltransferase [Microbacterium trichothecenolyticum]MDQ1122611.1 D-inositol-3-phosphate glycosyltransferase [Microbacterium trichothecenolyticum]